MDTERGTLNMSTFPTKDRRHKEASLKDISNFNNDPPLRMKKLTENEADITDDLYVNIEFFRGNGVDLRFPSTECRDEWFDEFSKVMESFNSTNIE